MRIKIFEKNIIVLRLLSRRWQAPGAVKKKKKKAQSRKNRTILPMPIHVFDDSEQKAEFKAKINQIVCNFYCSFICDILEGCDILWIVKISCF